MTTIGKILREYNQLMKDVDVNHLISKHDYETLLSAILQVNRQYLYLHLEQELIDTQIQSWLEKKQRYLNGEPLAYILGCSNFHGLMLKINTNVLIPRLDTELLVKITLQKLNLTVNDKNNENKLYIADLGTGSGAIALALAYEQPKWQLHAGDKNLLAIQLAQENAKNLNINNINFYHGDWCSALPKMQKYFAIVSNPPYIAKNDENVAKNVKQYEPHDALFAENAGLQDIINITSQALTRLEDCGYLILEHGWQQGEMVRKIMRNNHFINIETFKDFANHERVTCGQFRIKI